MQRRILVVEDETELREIIVSILKLDYAEVDEAENGEMGLSKVEEKAYSLVLTDINMPALSGLEFFANAKVKGIITPFVFLTAYGDQQNIMKALRLGAFDFIKKPFEEQEMRDVVSRAVEVGFRRREIQAQQSDGEVDLEKIKRDERMIRLLEWSNYKKRK